MSEPRGKCHRSKVPYDCSIVERLPSLVRSGEPIPSGLVGARIVSIGTLRDRTLIEGGGLVIDYLPRNKRRVRRVVLGCNELGMWIESADQGSS